MCDCGSTDIALAFKCMHAMCLGCYEQSCEESKSVVVDGHSVKLIRCPKCQMFDLVTMDEMIGMIKTLNKASEQKVRDLHELNAQKVKDIRDLHELNAQKFRDIQDLHELIAQKDRDIQCLHELNEQKECELHKLSLNMKERDW